MISPLEGSHAAPWLPWRMESSQEPRAAWYQGLLGELCHYKDGPFNTLLRVVQREHVLELAAKDAMGAEHDVAEEGEPAC